MTPTRHRAIAAAAVLASLSVASTTVASAPASATKPGSGWPLDGMVVMYLLMCAFHVAPWLKRLGDRRAIDDRSVEEESECSPR